MLNNGVEAFRAIMRCGNISSAAECLFISQPALSLRLNNLEKELGCRLFLRRKGMRNVELTAEGKQFAQLAERWNGLWRDMHNLSAKTRTMPLRIAAINSASTAVLPAICSDFSQLHPCASLQMEDLSSYASYDAIESRRVDFAIIVDQRYSLKAICRPLFTEKMKLVCSVKSSLPQSVNICQLDPQNHIYSPWFLEYEQWHRLQFGKDARPRLQIQIMAQLVSFLQQSETWSIVPATVERMLLKNRNIASRTLNAAVPERDVKYLVPDEDSVPYRDSFMNCFRHRLKLAAKKGLLRCLL